MVGREPAALQGVPVSVLCDAADIEALAAVLDRVGLNDPGAASEPEALERREGGDGPLDLRLRTDAGATVWVTAFASSILPAELAQPLLLVQWVDISARRRAERARAELLMEQAARTHAEAMAERLGRLQVLSSAIESVTLDQLLPELALRVAELFEAQSCEVEITGGPSEPVIVRAGATSLAGDEPPGADDTARREQMSLVIEGADVGALRLTLLPGRTFTATERSLLYEVAERAALSIHRAQLHQHEHLIAIELQRGLLPKSLPAVAGIELAAHYQAAGAGAEAGGDWYDAFPLSGDRIGLVVGDVTGRGVPAASKMGQLRSVTRAFALADDGTLTPGDVLSRLSRHQLALDHFELFTVIYAIIGQRGTIAWANAGHPPPLVRTAAGATRYLEGRQRLMGVEELVYEDYWAAVGAGDTMIMYSDGLIERRGESIDDGLARLTLAAAGGPDEPAALCEHILERVLPAEGGLHDDVTAVVARVV